jgi:hypothetical protein
MPRSFFVLLASLLVIATGGPSPPLAGAAEKPNVVLIYADDMD